MEITESYQHALPDDVLGRYDFFEVRNATRILQVTNREEYKDLVAVLREFRIIDERDILIPGGNETLTANWLNEAFRKKGWCEAAYSVTVASELILRSPSASAMQTSSEQTTSTYNVDNVKRRVALDVEWHAKDGNLDRDIAAYRTLYDSGIIDCAVMITMTRKDMRARALRLEPSTKKFSTSTTTNLEKVTPRLTRGDSGGCPVLIVSICDRTI